MPVGFEQQDDDFEPSVNDSIAQAEVEPTAEPVGWPQAPSAAAAVPFEESAEPPTDIDYPTVSSWQPAEAPNNVDDVDIEADVESDWPPAAQADVAADEGPVDEAVADEIADVPETPERDSFWRRERSFGRRKSEDEPQKDRGRGRAFMVVAWVRRGAGRY